MMDVCSVTQSNRISNEYKRKFRSDADIDEKMIERID